MSSVAADPPPSILAGISSDKMTPKVSFQHADLDYQADEAKWKARTARRLAEDPSLPNTPLPEGFPRVLTSTLVWEGKDWTDESQWVYNLSSAQLDEIDNALKHFRGLGLPIGCIDKATFPLPTLGPTIESLAQEIHSGRGFFVIRTIPVDSYSPEDNIIIYTGISAYVANVRGIQDINGAVLGHIKNMTETYSAKMLGAPAYTTEGQPFHSDPGDVVSLFALEVAPEGGASKVASSWRVYNELAQTRPDLVKTLSEPFPLEMFHGEPRYRMRSMLFVEDGKVIIQNARRLCTGYMGLPRSSDIPPISEAQAEAIDALHFLAERYQLKLTFQKGDIQYINNLSMFHARDGFTETAKQKRHLLRFWLRNKELAWKVPPVLQARWKLIYNVVPPSEQRFPVEPEIRSMSRGHWARMAAQEAARQEN